MTSSPLLNMPSRVEAWHSPRPSDVCPEAVQICRFRPVLLVQPGLERVQWCVDREFIATTSRVGNLLMTLLTEACIVGDSTVFDTA